MDSLGGPRVLSALKATIATLLCLACATSDAKLPRSRAAVAEFKRSHPCPTTGRRSGACPGYVIDHVIPLACGGRDRPANMQWQTRAQAREKDRRERVDCWRHRPPGGI